MNGLLESIFSLLLRPAVSTSPARLIRVEMWRFSTCIFSVLLFERFFVLISNPRPLPVRSNLPLLRWMFTSVVALAVVAALEVSF